MRLIPRTLRYLAILSILVSIVHAHKQKPLSKGSDWASRHLAEEHHIDNFDPGAFFTIHDFDADGSWTSDEILRTYGLMDESTKDVTEQKRADVVATIMRLMDYDSSGQISKAEWMRFNVEGGELPDFGLGPGHHGDDEYEYEIHHFEKYHDEYTKEEDLTHPEDIAHFKKHDDQIDEEERQAKLDRMTIVEQNIPQKFRRDRGKQ
ncbi:MAG: hypothetical protein M1813_004875 [Trichoglossum hirsutum]|nr:MAG: hypothetical protein M1813_004875 [Trichoglossum hirsutum]